MRSTSLVLVTALGVTLCCPGSSRSSSNPGRADERRIERSMRGRVDKETLQQEREERKLEEQPGAGEDKYRRREQREAAKRERELQKMSNQVVKMKKHSTNTIPPP